MARYDRSTGAPATPTRPRVARSRRAGARRRSCVAACCPRARRCAAQTRSLSPRPKLLRHRTRARSRAAGLTRIDVRAARSVAGSRADPFPALATGASAATRRGTRACRRESVRARARVASRWRAAMPSQDCCRIASAGLVAANVLRHSADAEPTSAAEAAAAVAEGGPQRLVQAIESPRGSAGGRPAEAAAGRCGRARRGSCRRAERPPPRRPRPDLARECRPNRRARPADRRAHGREERDRPRRQARGERRLRAGRDAQEPARQPRPPRRRATASRRRHASAAAARRVPAISAPDPRARRGARQARDARDRGRRYRGRQGDRRDARRAARARAAQCDGPRCRECRAASGRRQAGRRDDPLARVCAKASTSSSKSRTTAAGSTSRASARWRRSAASSTAEELASMNDTQLIDLIFAPGFSTAAAVTQVSGRGVGMDAVRTAVEPARRARRSAQRRGQGHDGALHAPVQRAGHAGHDRRGGGQTFGIPLDAVVETIRVPQDGIFPVGAAHAIVLRNRTIPLVRLSAGARRSERRTATRRARS